MGKVRIAVYGLSTETQRMIKEWNGKYEIVGLLDSFQTTGQQFGYPIVSLEGAFSLGITRIIVVARPGSCKAIAKKIGKPCKSNSIELYDVRGIDLLQEKEVAYHFKGHKGYQKDKLENMMQTVDAVSFDIFDTLLVRTITDRNDLFEILNKRRKKEHIDLSDFSERRLAAEKRLSQENSPHLTEIYQSMGLEVEESKLLAEMEFELDQNLIIPRNAVVDLLKLAKRMGKKVYLTSDMYYSKEQIEKLLKLCDVPEVEDILISCEYGVGKSDGLFEYLIQRAETDRILHIGDDLVADIRAADKWGIASFQIYSPMELLDMVGGLKLQECCSTLSDRMKVGMFAANLFNNPFQFEDEEKRILVDDGGNIGYLFCAPMIIDFVQWFGEQIREKELRNIWFCARDGFLIQKIFQKMYKGTESEYFLTSRISAIRAGVSDVSDVAYVDSMKFSGTVEENLKVRFGIDVQEIPKKHKKESDGLRNYTEQILLSARKKRRNNCRYIETLNRKEGGIAFFDFVAKGTSQMYIQKMVSNPMIGYYFLQLEPEFMKDKDLTIKPFYSEQEKEQSAIFDNYYVMETILTSPEPSVEEFDEEGKPVYSPETRSKQDIDCMRKVQEGILSYVDRMLEIFSPEEIHINKRLDEVFLTLIHEVEIRDADFMNLTVEDPFFNRGTNMTNILVKIN